MKDKNKKRLAPGLALALAIMGAGPAGAKDQPYSFTSVVIGGGGYVPALVFSRAEEGLAYLRTDIGGAYRHDKGASQWVPLLDAVPEARLMGVESIAADPHTPGRVYAALGMYSGQKAALARSDDKGAHWQMFEAPFAMGGNEDGRGMGERLAIDPAASDVLWFGSRHDGLWRSGDRGAHWQKQAAFPYAGAGQPPKYQTHGGIGFVVFDARPGQHRMAAGVSDPGQGAVYLSDDGGASWHAVPAGPAGMVPTRAEFAADGTLFVTFDDWIGPNGVHKGAVWALSAQGNWRDITPERGAEGGYMGLATDPAAPGTVVVASLDRWHPGDTLWRSTDAGAHWEDLSRRSTRDVAFSAWLDHVGGSEHMGHWMSALAIDPFHPSHIAYGTGATVFEAGNLGNSGPVDWHVWTQGIEETVPLALVSPTGGAPLLSGLGDIGGFAHDRLDAAPARPHIDPFLPNTNSLDYAGLAPRFVVRSGTARNPDPKTVATLALSEDGGHTWRPLRVPPLAAEPGGPAERFDTTGDASIVIGADGGTLVVNTPVPLFSHDGGKSWRPCAGLPTHSRVIADKADPKRFYAVEFDSGLVLASTDAAESFLAVPARSLPAKLADLKPWNREKPLQFMAAPGRVGDLWMRVNGALYVSRDGAQSFRRRTASDIWIDSFTLGAPLRAGGWPVLFAKAGGAGGIGLYRSLDGGETWARINGKADVWGNEISALEGDPRVAGRVYVGVGGRGIMVGEPAR